jgi:hypothetical protein
MTVWVNEYYLPPILTLGLLCSSIQVQMASHIDDMRVLTYDREHTMSQHHIVVITEFMGHTSQSPVDCTLFLQRVQFVLGNVNSLVLANPLSLDDAWTRATGEDSQSGIYSTFGIVEERLRTHQPTPDCPKLVTARRAQPFVTHVVLR